MSQTSVLSAPTEDMVLRGGAHLHRWWPYQATAASPVVDTNMEGIQSLTANPVAYEVEEEYFHQGSNQRYKFRDRKKWTGSISILAGEIPTLMAALFNKTYGSGGDYGYILRMPSTPILTMGVVSRKNNQTDDKEP